MHADNIITLRQLSAHACIPCRWSRLLPSCSFSPLPPPPLLLLLPLLPLLLPLQAWDSPGTGLIINERLINCPPQLAPPLLQALLDEVAWATEDEPTQVCATTTMYCHHNVLPPQCTADCLQ
jgi:BCCIP